MAEGQEGGIPPQAKQSESIIKHIKGILSGGNRQIPVEQPFGRENKAVAQAPLIVDGSALSGQNPLIGRELITAPTTEGEKGNKYGFVREGGLVYIVDEAGNKVSDGYHSYELFTSSAPDGTEIKGILAKLGAMSVALRPPTEENNRFQPSAEKFHDIHYRADLGGVFVTQTGAMQQIVDNDGRPITGTYHEFFMRDGKLYGKMGAHIEQIYPKKSQESVGTLRLQSPK